MGVGRTAKRRVVPALFVAVLVSIGALIPCAYGAGENGVSARLEVAGRLEVINGRPTMVYSDPWLRAPHAVDARAALPASYDLRDERRATGVRDQSYFGTCWAFAALGFAESNALSRGLASSDLDLSESQLAWFNANGKNNDPDASLYAGGDSWFIPSDPINIGGSRNYSVPTLARGYGMTDEATIPYGHIEGSWPPEFLAPDPSMQTRSDLRLSEALYLPEPLVLQNGRWDGASEVNRISLAAIKRAVMDNGAVDVGYYASDAFAGSVASDPFWNDEHFSTFYDGRPIEREGGIAAANHEVVIIGWDDGFPSDWFSSKPEGDGAWIVKNSWGGEWGDEGCFYLSYYDKSICEPTSFIVEDADYQPSAGGASRTLHEYDNFYQYDGVGKGDRVFYLNEPAYCANLYTARSTELVRAVGTYTYGARDRVTVKLYLNPADPGNPASGELKAVLDRTLDYGGYHTIDLGSEAFAVEEGDVVAVAVRVEFGSFPGIFALSAESSVEGGGADISYEEGQSYFMEESVGDWIPLDRVASVVGEQVTVGNALAKMLTCDVPVATGGVYDPTKTLADYALAAPGAGRWEWKDPATVPACDFNEIGYPALYTPREGAEAIECNVRMLLEKAPVDFGRPSASPLEAGQRLGDSAISGPAAAYRWTQPDLMPETGTHAYEAVAVPGDPSNYRETPGTVEVTVSAAVGKGEESDRSARLLLAATGDGAAAGGFVCSALAACSVAALAWSRRSPSRR